jgi:hypothetical protein
MAARSKYIQNNKGNVIWEAWSEGTTRRIAFPVK